MDDLISRQSVNDAMDRTCDLVCEYSKEQRYTMCGACPLGCAFDAVADLPSAQPDIKNEQARVAVYEQGRIQGHVEMRTELLMSLKEIVWDEVWKNI